MTIKDERGAQTITLDTRNSKNYFRASEVNGKLYFNVFKCSCYLHQRYHWQNCLVFIPPKIKMGSWILMRMPSLSALFIEIVYLRVTKNVTWQNARCSTPTTQHVIAENGSTSDHFTQMFAEALKQKQLPLVAQTPLKKHPGNYKVIVLEPRF